MVEFNRKRNRIKIIPDSKLIKKFERLSPPLPSDKEHARLVLEGKLPPIPAEKKAEFTKRYFIEKEGEFPGSYRRIPKIMGLELWFREGWLDLEEIKKSGNLRTKIQERHDILVRKFETYKKQNSDFEEVKNILKDEIERLSEDSYVNRFLDYQIIRNRHFIDEIKKLFD